MNAEFNGPAASRYYIVTAENYLAAEQLMRSCSGGSDSIIAWVNPNKALQQRGVEVIYR
ncbi:hypothetical protein [Croceicoccus mobilis]|uniref:hypothetical protein n=1 Tax=Croceicoccus mobilis TaxID=1703339 RepID=UPI0012E725A3|nr:hypothetical protein [Croceicoccus mobilis]